MDALSDSRRIPAGACQREGGTGQDGGRYRAVHVVANGYRGSQPQLDVIDPGLPGVIAGHADRTGITAPRVPERAVYQLYIRQQLLMCLHIYEDGEFVPIQEWYDRQGL